ncbi:FUSC family protein [Roseateles sp. BYS78W]|uniref:FUSC family protein n=1 Tax=Pelomonas candidula TaxID=3299025 RepID=A0ABW7HKA5_9BURK
MDAAAPLLGRLRAQLPSTGEWLTSAKTFAAAMLALYLALAAGLPRPYWAMATAYVVSSPLTGATQSKGLYRLIGTLLAAFAAVLVVPLLVDTPLLLSLFIASWVGVLLQLSFRDRMPSSYVYMLSAITLPMIALPVVQAPDQVFAIAVARCEEIFLGMTCAALVSALVLPGRAAPALEGRFSAWFDDAADWTAGVLLGESAARRSVSVHRLAGDVLALDQLINHLRHDSDHRDAARVARELRLRLSALLPILGSLRDAVAGLRRSPAGEPAFVAALLEDIYTWMRAPLPAGAGEASAALLLRLHTFARAEVRDDPHALQLRHVLRRLESLVQLWQDCRSLQQMLADGRWADGWRPAFTRWRRHPQVHHHDRGLQAYAAFTAGSATFLACLFWIFSGWSDGASAVAMCAVTSSFFAQQDEPLAMQLTFLLANTLGLVVGAVLLFCALPAAQEFVTLVLVLAPFFLVAGSYLARPAFAALALGLSVTVTLNLAVADAYRPDFMPLANGCVAGIAGSIWALVWTQLARPFGTRLSAHRLLRSAWQDLARTAAGRHRGDDDRLRAHMLDRLAQMMPRLAATSGSQGTEGLAELRVGLSAALLLRLRRQLRPPARLTLQRLLDALEIHYRRRLRTPASTALPPRPTLERRLAAALGAVGHDAADAPREALHALIEIQLTLFPPAPAGAQEK